jgi:hypothetical protein
MYKIGLKEVIYMAFFLKLMVFSVWVVIMAALIIGSIQCSKRFRRGRRYEKIKPAGEKENGRFFFLPAYMDMSGEPLFYN